MATCLVVILANPLKTNYGLSKSRLLSHLQCAKRLYLEVHYPELAEIDESGEMLFATGKKVGELARQLHPGGGVLVEADSGLSQALARTRELIGEEPKQSLFEATFEHQGVLIRADILAAVGRGRWDLIEVKASTSVKDVHVSDCAIQAWVLEGAGLDPRRTYLSHIDTDFVYPGDGRYEGLFRHEDITDQVQALIPTVARWVSASRKTLSGSEPVIGVGDQCHTPYECPFLTHCTPPETTEYPVGILPRGGALAEQLRAEGIEDVRDIPVGRLTRPLHERIRRVTISGEPELDQAAGRQLRKLPYPRYYLDFETVNFAVPIWAGTSPYQQLPFQWSCHIEDAPGSLRQMEYLDTSGAAPMRPLTEKLLATLGTAGPIFVYSGFEKLVINGLADMYPDLSGPREQLTERLVDLLPITRAHYYHPAMKGRWSIKTVLPTIAPDLAYENLGEVQEGGGAQAAFLEAVDVSTSAERRRELTEALHRYCSRDTLGMVELVHHFLAG